MDVRLVLFGFLIHHYKLNKLQHLNSHYMRYNLQQIDHKICKFYHLEKDIEVHSRNFCYKLNISN